MSKKLQSIRKKKPLIHVLTNEVVANFTANGLLALGASPIMAKEYDEIEDISSMADGIFLNIGTLRKTDQASFLLAGKVGNKLGTPLVLDPVGVAASNFRRDFIKELLKEIHFTAIKGNPGEIAFLAGELWETKGVDSADGNLDQTIQLAKKLSHKHDTIIVVTGAVDVIAYKEKVKLNREGHKLLKNVTGTGCLLGGVITSFLATESDSFQATYQAVNFYTRAARLTADQSNIKGPGSFMNSFIDQLYKGDQDERKLFT